MACEIEAAFAWHHDVEDQEIEMQAGQLGSRISRALGDGDAIAFARQKARHQIANAAIVLDHHEMRCVVGRNLWPACRGHCRDEIFSHGVPCGAPFAAAMMICNTLSGSLRSTMLRRKRRTTSVSAALISPSA